MDDELVCPHCLYEFTDSWELFEEHDLIDALCPQCGQTFRASQDTHTTYSSEKL